MTATRVSKPRQQRPPLPLPANHVGLRERFGDALQRQRQKCGFSQTTLAKRSGLSPKYVGEIERGEANPSLDLIERLCVVLDWRPFEVWVASAESEILPTPSVASILASNYRQLGQLAQDGLAVVEAIQREAAFRNEPIRNRRGRPRRGTQRPPQDDDDADDGDDEPTPEGVITT